MRFVVVRCADEVDHHGRHQYRYSHAGVSMDAGFAVDDFIRAPSMEGAKAWVRQMYPGATFSDEDDPAAPHPWLETEPEERAAHMTLRDHFAGQIINSIIAYGDNAWSPGAKAAKAYEYADAMLEARKR